MATRSKKHKDVKKLERLSRNLKKQEKEIGSELTTYGNMIDDFEKNINLFKFICHASVIAQDEKYKHISIDDHSDEHKEKYTRIAELQKLDIAIKAINDSHLQKVRNIFSLLKKVKKDIPKVIGVTGEQLLPAMTDLQIATINLLDMVNQCIPKNREALEEMAEKNPQFRAILGAIDTLNKNIKTNQEQKEEVEVTELDLPFTTEALEETVVEE